MTRNARGGRASVRSGFQRLEEREAGLAMPEATTASAVAPASGPHRHASEWVGRSAVPRATSVAPRRRVAYFINFFPNLIETMIYREVEALRGSGYEVHTYSIRRPPNSLIPADARVMAARTTYLLPVSPGRLLVRHLRALTRSPIRYWRILAEVVGGTHARFRDRVRTLCHFVEAVTVLPDIERLEIDQLHAHWAVGATTCAMVVSRFLNIPFSFTAHAYDIWREQLLLPEKLRAAALTITCTDYNRRHLIEAYGAEPARVRVVYHGLDVKRFSPRAGSENAVPVILSVGRLVEQKGFDRLLRACARLVATGQRFRCDIIGEGPLRVPLESLVTSLRLEGTVRFLGMLSQQDVIDQYATADIFSLLCVPAADDDRDGIPNTAIEAMAMELPVISTRFSGLPELIVDGETGILVDTDDVDGAAAALRSLLTDRIRRRRMGIAARRRVVDQFTIDASVAALDDAFTRIPSSCLQAFRGERRCAGSVESDASNCCRDDVRTHR